MFARYHLLDDQDPTQKIVDSPLTVIFMMGQGVRREYF